MDEKKKISIEDIMTLIKEVPDEEKEEARKNLEQEIEKFKDSKKSEGDLINEWLEKNDR